MPLTISNVCRNITPSTTLRLNAMVIEKRAQGLDIISLGTGEPDFPTPPHICDAAKRAIDNGKTKYTAVEGVPDLRKAVADHLANTKGLRHAPSEVLIGTGAKQVLIEALHAVLDPGDEVILPAPCWLSYPEMVRMAGGVPVVVTSSAAEGFMPAASSIAAAVTPRTKAIILNTPNNPTGAVWGRDLLKAVGDIAVQHDFYIISDEIYETLIYGEARHVPVATLSDDIFRRTITVSGFSKAYAMTGWRLGYASGPRDVIAAMAAYQSHATGNTSSIVQYAGLEAITASQQSVQDMRAAFERRRNMMVQMVANIPGVTCAEPNGAFYVLLNISSLLGATCSGAVIDNDTTFAELLLEHALVSVVPGEPFYAPGCVRLTYALADDRAAEAMRRIAAFVKSLDMSAAS